MRPLPPCSRNDGEGSRKLLQETTKEQNTESASGFSNSIEVDVRCSLPWCSCCVSVALERSMYSIVFARYMPIHGIMFWVVVVWKVKSSLVWLNLSQQVGKIVCWCVGRSCSCVGI